MCDYVLNTILFEKYNDNDEAFKDKDGKLILFKPKGRWKHLEFLCEGTDDDDYEPMHLSKVFNSLKAAEKCIAYFERKQNELSINDNT